MGIGRTTADPPVLVIKLPLGLTTIGPPPPALARGGSPDLILWSDDFVGRQQGGNRHNVRATSGLLDHGSPFHCPQALVVREY